MLSDLMPPNINRREVALKEADMTEHKHAHQHHLHFTEKIEVHSGELLDWSYVAS